MTMMFNNCDPLFVVFPVAQTQLQNLFFVTDDILDIPTKEENEIKNRYNIDEAIPKNQEHREENDESQGGVA